MHQPITIHHYKNVHVHFFILTTKSKCNAKSQLSPPREPDLATIEEDKEMAPAANKVQDGDSNKPGRSDEPKKTMRDLWVMAAIK